MNVFIKKHILFVFLFSTALVAQERKTLSAIPRTIAPQIDGIISQGEWSMSTPATNFSLWIPNTENGKKPLPGYETIVGLEYDNDAVYIVGILKDPDPTAIPRQISERDDIWEVNAETFFVSINTYDDHTNYQSFQVTSAGTIGDKYSSGRSTNEDKNFDTVFEAKVSINEIGWIVEMKIPFSALRFPKKNIQEWGINFGRKIKKFNETFTWNYVDVKNSNFMQSMGLVKGLKNINPPTRLFFYPYLQVARNLQNNTSPNSSYSAGMDVKYGINNSFTIDATLIPDFSQVTFDNKELNLSPFEQQFDENRAFFTEGASMFKKADDRGFNSGAFFYSRRIGQEINIHDSDVLALEGNDSLLSYDLKPKLINALKLTGTTNKNLSIGFLNAITDKAYATIENTAQHSLRKELIAPLTHYNVISLSQQIINNYSFLSLINTHVNRTSGWKNSNNIAAVLDITTKNQQYKFKSSFYKSHVPRFSAKSGSRGTLTLNELKGNFRFQFKWLFADNNYYQQELGYYNQINNQVFSSRIRFESFKQNSFFKTYSNYLYMSYRSRFEPFERKSYGFRFGNDLMTQNFFKYELDFDYTSTYKDFDEPRSENTFIIEPVRFEVKFGINSDDRRNLVYGVEISKINYYDEPFNEKRYRNRYGFNVSHRFSNRLNMSVSNRIMVDHDDIGYVEKIDENIFFGRRLVKSVENNINFQYNFDADKSIKLKFRNFWSSANYDPILFLLQSDGTRQLTSFDLLDENPNTQFNIWNLDLGFDWWFAPGSKITLLYRNQIFSDRHQVDLDYFRSVQDLFSENINHQFSLRINYYLDYNILKKKNGKKRV